MFQHPVVRSIIVGLSLVNLCLTTPLASDARRPDPDVQVLLRDGDVVDGRTIAFLAQEVDLTPSLDVIVLANFTDGRAGFVSTQRGILVTLGDRIGGEVLRGTSTPGAGG